MPDFSYFDAFIHKNEVNVPIFKMDDILDYMNSSYEGEYKNKRMEGNGNYKFATDTKYEGEWKDGMFHGKGTLIFSDGSKYVATWEKGIALEGQYFFEDGLDFDEVFT